jgi:Histidinol dehydrogenase
VSVILKALFLGEKTRLSHGDKAIGTNQALPTLGAARYTGGLWVGKYLKTVTYEEIDNADFSAELGPIRPRGDAGELRRPRLIRRRTGSQVRRRKATARAATTSLTSGSHIPNAHAEAPTPRFSYPPRTGAVGCRKPFQPTGFTAHRFHARLVSSHRQISSAHRRNPRWP